MANDEAKAGQPTVDQATGDCATGDRATGDQATGNRATDNRATDNRATDNRPTDNRATDNRPTGNEATGDQPTSLRATDIAQADGTEAVVIRVLIADDLALLRGSFRVLIEHSPDCTVVGEAADGIEAVALTAELQPDVVLMDIRMPGLDGIEATRQICADPANAARVLILTTFDLDEYVYGALRAGASGFLLKDARPTELLAGIRLVASGEAMLAPTVTRRLIVEFVRHSSSAMPPGQATPPDRQAQLSQAAHRDEARVLVRDPGGITGREREILTLIAVGLSNAEIAGRLLLSVPTVKTHVGRLLTKCGARDRTQLVILAYETGLVTPA